MEWLQYLVAPALVGVGTVVGWLIKERIDRRREIEESLREKRADLYEKILDPYIRIWSNDSKKSLPKAMRDIGSFEYRKTAFRLTLLGSDNVVNAWNEFAQYLYLQEREQSKDPMKLFRLFSAFLLEIRKSVGNEDTSLHSKDMLSWMIKDIDTIFPDQADKKIKAV